MIKSRKAQLSIEYLIIMSFVLFIILILMASYMIYQQHYESDVVTSQVKRIAITLADTSEEVYYYGEPSKSTVKIYMPPDVVRVNFSGKGVIFRVRTPGGESDIEAYASVNMSGNLSTSQGLKLVEISARKGYVWIEER